jgi:hypothetical protein
MTLKTKLKVLGLFLRCRQGGDELKVLGLFLRCRHRGEILGARRDRKRFKRFAFLRS